MLDCQTQTNPNRLIEFDWFFVLFCSIRIPQDFYCGVTYPNYVQDYIQGKQKLFLRKWDIIKKPVVLCQK